MARQFDVIDLKPGDPRWERFVASQSAALPYHHPAWSAVLAETFGYRLAAAGCLDVAGRLTGVLPLMEKKSLLAGRYLASLPNTPTAGPLAADRDSLAALLRGAMERVDHSSASWLQLKAEDPAMDRLVPGFSGGSRDPTYVLNLPDDPEQLRFGNSRHHTAIRRNVRQAARSGVTVREASSASDVRRWYRLYLATMRAHATPPRPLRLFEVIWDILVPLDLARWLLAERSEGGRTRLLAGSLFLASSGTVVYAFNGRDRAQLQYRPNDAIHWRAITDACQAGQRSYDFGEVSRGNEGLARFKEKWGAAPVDLYRYSYPRWQDPEQGPLSSRPVRWASGQVWGRLPLSATAALGGWVYGRL